MSGAVTPILGSAEVTGDQSTAADPGSMPTGVRYALLVAHSANRVYADQAARLTGAELAVFANTVLDTELHEIVETQIAGVGYVGFRATGPLTEQDVAYLSRISTAYALFCRQGELLQPVPLPSFARFDDDLVTIPKYAGKTNEQFTQLLLNLTVLASTRARQLSQQRLVVLDPLCGRGTTMSVAARYGYDAIGIERDESQVEAFGAFLRSWLRRKRLKHTVDTARVRHDRKQVARRLSATLAPDKDAYRAGDVQRITVFQADTTRARELLKVGCCDVIVTDAPYGVAHGSRTGNRSGSSRNPLSLLQEAVPGWAALLRRGGALGLSFNTHVARRQQVAQVLADAGLTVLDNPVYGGFSHWVDQGITRDIVVARQSSR